MEGGVLRKEDEEKYSKMLPQTTDTREVAKQKLDGVKRMLDQKRQGYLSDFSASGYDTSGLEALDLGAGTEASGIATGIQSGATNAYYKDLAKQMGITPEELFNRLNK